jgi:hypothetical protein
MVSYTTRHAYTTQCRDPAAPSSPSPLPSSPPPVVATLPPLASPSPVVATLPPLAVILSIYLSLFVAEPPHSHPLTHKFKVAFLGPRRRRMLAAWLVVAAPPPRERSKPLRPAAISLFADPQQDRLAAPQAGLVSDSTPQQERSTQQDKPLVTPQKVKPHEAKPPVPQKAKPHEVKPPAVQSEWVSRWTPHMLSDLYKHGKPSNDISQAGLMVHAFDDTEDWHEQWKPCHKDQWCEQFDKHWSASIINSKQPNTWTTSGILLHPDKARNQVLCSGVVDIATYNSGCKKPNTNDKIYKPNELKDMLDESMNNCGARCNNYNEVVINSTYYVQNLPRSILAIIYFDDAAGKEQVKAIETYVALLDKFHLTECELPLLKIVRGDYSDAEERARHHSVVIDMSSSARAALDSHAFDRFRDKHPALKLPVRGPANRTKANLRPMDPFEETAPFDRNGCHLIDLAPGAPPNPPPATPPFGVTATPIPAATNPALTPAIPAVPATDPSSPTPSPPAPPVSPSPAPPRVSIEGLDSMFADGRPSNGIGKAGLLFHAFDGTEDYRELWKPCTMGWCVKYSVEWSTSLINARQRNSFGSSGILLTPYANKVLCSWPEDMSTKTNTQGSCGSKLDDGALPYPPEQLREMLEISMADGAPPLYNEVVVDSQAYVQGLPSSIAAVAYYDDSTAEEQIKATETYLAMLQACTGRRLVEL